MSRVIVTLCNIFDSVPNRSLLAAVKIWQYDDCFIGAPWDILQGYIINLCDLFSVRQTNALVPFPQLYGKNLYTNGLLWPIPNIRISFSCPWKLKENAVELFINKSLLSSGIIRAIQAKILPPGVVHDMH